MTPLYGHSQTVAAFIAKLIPGCERGFGPCQAIGVLNDAGELVGGWVYYDYDPEAGVIQVSGAATDKRWLTRPVLKALFAYPWDDLGCQMIVTRQSVHNKAPRRMWGQAGGVEYIIPRLRGRNEDECLICVTDDAWKASKVGRLCRG